MLASSTLSVQSKTTSGYDSEILALLIAEVKDYAIFVIDACGCVVTWNQGAENIKGYNSNEIIGKHISIFYTQDDVTANIPYRNLQQASIKGTYEDEGWRVRKDGSLFWANIVFTALYNNDGTIKGFAKITRDITQRKQNEEKLASLAILIENTSEAVFSTTPALNILTWNKGAEKIYGYNAAEVLGQTTLATIKPQITEAFLTERNSIIAKTGFWNGEITHQHKAGNFITVSASISGVRNSQGDISSYAFIVRDITSQKLAEEKISYLANIVEQTTDAIFSYDADTKIVSWNKAAEGVYGYTASEAINQRVTDLIKTELDETRRAEIRAQVFEKGRWAGEVIQKRKDGSAVNISVSLTVIHGADGNIAEQICICRDITLKKKAEETERRLKQQLDKLLQNKLDSTLKELSDYKYALDKSSIVAVTNQKGIIEYVNDNFCTISGYSREELLGNDHRMINSGYHDAGFIRGLWVTIANGKVWKGELKNKAKNGTYYWVDTTIIPFLNDEKKPYQYVAIRADITERKAAENALNTLNTELEHRVEQRTQQLAKANQELEAFSYSISHDLRAPLRSISGFAGIINDEYGHLLDKEGERLLQKITNNSVAMGRLIDGLLSFMRLTKIDAVSTYVDMHNVAKHCIEELQQSINVPATTSITLQELAPCNGDSNMLRQVWLNLIGNAIKYSSKKPQPAIIISSYARDEKTVYVIKDNGAGFDMQYYSNLFNVFQRLHAASEFEGTGVGLAIIKLIVNKHGGEVWAESILGEGSTFYFNLPKI